MAYKDKFNIDYNVVTTKVIFAYTIEGTPLLNIGINRGKTFEMRVQRHTQSLETDEKQLVT